MARRQRSVSKEAEPTRVSDALRGLVGRRGWNRNLALGRLRANWSHIVGLQIAARSEPLKLVDGRLTIRAEGGAWAAELALLGASLAAAAGRYLGSDLVREVMVVAGTPPGLRDLDSETP